MSQPALSIYNVVHTYGVAVVGIDAYTMKHIAIEVAKVTADTITEDATQRYQFATVQHHVSDDGCTHVVTSPMGEQRVTVKKTGVHTISDVMDLPDDDLPADEGGVVNIDADPDQADWPKGRCRDHLRVVE